MKSKNIIVRVTNEEHDLLSLKASILGINRSSLLRDGAFCFWDGEKPDAGDLLRRFKEGSERIKSTVVDLIFEYYRRKGYPHHFLSPPELLKEMAKLAKTQSPLLPDDHLQSNTVGLTVPNHFHPHMIKVHCLQGYRSAFDQFIDDDLFKNAIRRWMHLGNKPSSSGLRRILRTRDGVRSVVNFKPAVARFLYDEFCPSGGKTLDPCAGYGGRLAGVIASNRGIHYHGIDPHGETAVGNMRMASFFSKPHDIIGREWKFDFSFDLGCAEDVMPQLRSESYDLVNASPPFHAVEKYSTEPTQSYIRFPEYSDWRDNFLGVIVRESHRLLRDNGYLILNVKNYRKKPIADDAVKMAETVGFRLVRTFHQKMPNSEYTRTNKDDPDFEESINWHTEPILVFVK